LGREKERVCLVFCRPRIREKEGKRGKREGKGEKLFFSSLSLGGGGEERKEGGKFS